MQRAVFLVISLILSLAAISEGQEVENPLKFMRKVDDPDRGLVFYFDKTTPSEANKMAFYLFVGKYERRSPFIMMKIQDTGEDYLNIKKYRFIVDGLEYELIPEREGDIRKGGQPRAKIHILNKKKPTQTYETVKPMTFEYYERSIRKSQVEMLQRISTSAVTTIIYVGVEEEKSHIVTAEEKEAISRVLQTFLYIGGDFDLLRD
jgi:hypothetical protein